MFDHLEASETISGNWESFETVQNMPGYLEPCFGRSEASETIFGHVRFQSQRGPKMLPKQLAEALTSFSSFGRRAPVPCVAGSFQAISSRKERMRGPFGPDRPQCTAKLRRVPETIPSNHPHQ